MLALCSLGSIVLIVGVCVFLTSLYQYSQDLPDHKKLKEYEPSIMTRLYGGDGTLVGEYASEKRIYIPIYAIPPKVIYSFLSAEDKNFYSHKGVDFYGIMRAVVNNIDNIRKGRRLEGASTITQQVAKNFLLTNEVSLDRKIKEALLAFRIEDAFSKDHILALYLNQIYLGNRSYGVAAAALNYFDKSLDELELEEAALLASLPKAPSAFDPFRNPKRARQRRDWVLSRLYEDGRITHAQMTLAQAKPITLTRPNRNSFVDARYFSEEVRRELVDQYGKDIIYFGGLSVRTSLDPDLQKYAIDALREGLENYDRRTGYKGPVKVLKTLDQWQDALENIQKPANTRDEWEMAVVTSSNWEKLNIGFVDGREGFIPLKKLGWARKAVTSSDQYLQDVRAANEVTPVGSVILVEKDPEDQGKGYLLRQQVRVQGGIVALDPHTGRVLAMQGGYEADISGFNRVTQAKRQPGSAFKPFVYLAALDDGFTPANLVLDAPFVIDQGPGLPKWRPSNYTNEFYGPTPLRVGIEKSKNLMTVRLAYHIGMEKISDYAKKFGIDQDMPKALSMSLGAGETTLIDLTSAYAVLVNGGKKVTPTFIDRIQNREGETIYKKAQFKCMGCTELEEWEDQSMPLIKDMRQQISDPRTSYQIVSMLEGVVQRGTARRLRSLNRPLAGKTGTTNDSRDAWFIGFSPDLVVGVYVGYDQPRTLGRKQTGSNVAAPIFGTFMKKALADKPKTPFRIPDGLERVRINADTGTAAKAGDERVIWETFLPGTAPTSQQYLLDKSGLNLMVGDDPTGSKSSTTIGTGGLY